jgi:integrase
MIFMGKRNPNGYGCVTKLSGNRSKPWMVKVTVYDGEGFARQKPIGYAETEERANIILAQYNNNPWEIDREKVTLAALYQRWAEIKMPKLSTSTRSSLQSAFKHCTKYYGVKYRSMKSYQMQDCIDNCGYGSSTQAAIKNLFGHLDRFAFELDVIDKMYSQLTSITPPPETTRTPFTAGQVDALWSIAEEPWTDTVLMYLYTGFRLTELLGMKTEDVNLKDGYFRGGVKTAAGKERIVPIHHRILPLVQKRAAQGETYLISNNGEKVSRQGYYKFWGGVMKKIDADKTPHEARHTFETNLDNAGGNRKCIDMLMGHKSKDIGNRVYNHKTIDQLRETIELLK